MYVYTATIIKKRKYFIYEKLIIVLCTLPQFQSSRNGTRPCKYFSLPVIRIQKYVMNFQISTYILQKVNFPDRLALFWCSLFSHITI
jgi:hypothetical protein